MTVNVAGRLVPPDVPGVLTVTGIVPIVATDAAGTVAVRTPGAARVVARAAPPKLIVDDAEKPVPVTESTNVGEPAVLNDGDSSVIAGAVPTVTVNVAGALVPPLAPGVVTATRT